MHVVCTLFSYAGVPFMYILFFVCMRFSFSYVVELFFSPVFFYVFFCSAGVVSLYMSVFSRTYVEVSVGMNITCFSSAGCVFLSFAGVFFFFPPVVCFFFFCLQVNCVFVYIYIYILLLLSYAS